MTTKQKQKPPPPSYLVHAIAQCAESIVVCQYFKMAEPADMNLYLTKGPKDDLKMYAFHFKVTRAKSKNITFHLMTVLTLPPPHNEEKMMKKFVTKLTFLSM